MSSPVIEVNHFKKTYGSYCAVEDLSFEVYEGEIFGLLGPNGAGKTTTLESLEGIRIPDRGKLRILGLDPTRQSTTLRNLVGVQLQSSALPGSMTPREAIQFFCAYHGVSPRYELLDRLGLSEKESTQYSMLSIGQQRRLALALAMGHKPKVLFLDEPTAGLDVPSRIRLHEIMAELKAEGTTIILATHDMAEAEKMSDRVAILLKGKISTQGTPAQITATGSSLTRISISSEAFCLQKNGHSFPAVQQVLNKDEYTILFSSHPGKTVTAVLAYLEDQGDKLIDLRVERPTLEERFLEITNGN
jgi:ABC-2 type transport system ATP-binding protein